jgi:O-Antigen ligase
MLASVLITSRKALRAVLWGMVIATGLKAFQGLYVFLSVRHMHPRPEAILGHEEAFFFGLFIFLTLALWLFDVRGRLRTTATWLLPVVMAANLANNRRAAWVVLAGGLMVLTAIGLRYLPSRRALLSRAVAVVLVVSAVYFPTYWNHTGTLAQPARALRSAVAPDPRDASSDLYRIQENANLNLNIKEAGLLGKGFGVPIDYALPIADLTGIDPLITYIPHNGVLYVLMRMGLLGGVALWAVLATGIISGCRLARSVDRELAVVGALLAAALIGWALEGALDQGFFFYRIAFVVGSLLGLAEAASRLPQAVPRSGP